jgi:hypothetical protein
MFHPVTFWDSEKNRKKKEKRGEKIINEIKDYQ